MEIAARKKPAIDDQHLVTYTKEAGALTDEEKIRKIQYHFEQIMKALGLDLEDDSLRDTPERVAKMYVQEMFSGLNPDNFPSISLFDNTYHYKGMLVEKDIRLYSCCEHHFVPIIGKVHVAYFPTDKVIGLSKINRLVRYYARRPQVQERLTCEIAGGLKFVLDTEDVAVYIEASHLCVAARGVEDTHSSTVTTSFNGRFEQDKNREAFYSSFK